MVKRAWSVIAVVFSGIILVVLATAGWNWYRHLNDRVFASFRNHSDMGVSARDYRFDPTQNILTLINGRMSFPGLNIKADTIKVSITPPRWFDIWRRKIPVTPTQLTINNAVIDVKPESLDIPYSQLELIEINQAQLGVWKGVQALQLSELQLKPETGGKYQVMAQGAVEPWLLEGELTQSDTSLRGTLSYENNDLSEVLGSSRVHGDIQIESRVFWSPKTGSVLNAQAKGSAGQFQFDDFVLNWQGWETEPFQTTWMMDRKPKISVQLISPGIQFEQQISLEKNEKDRSDLPVIFQQLKADEFEIAFGGEDIKLDNARFALATSEQNYHFSAKISEGGKVEASGQLFERLAESGLQKIALTNVPWSPFWQQFSPIDSIGKKSRFDFTYHQKQRQADLVISHWQKNQKTFSTASLAERLLASAKGRGTLLVPLEPNVGLATLGQSVKRNARQQMDSIAKRPFQYLSTLVPNSFYPYLEHQPGLAELSESGQQNLQLMKTLAELRPWLRWEIHTAVSEEKDWPVLASQELKKTLYELSKASHQDGNDIPESVRENLIERMYLGTQKQKLPDIGFQSKEERIKHAEKWLINSWPENPGLMKELQDGRINLLHSEIQQAGFAGRVTIQPSVYNAPDTRAQLILQ